MYGFSETRMNRAFFRSSLFSLRRYGRNMFDLCIVNVRNMVRKWSVFLWQRGSAASATLFIEIFFFSRLKKPGFIVIFSGKSPENRRVCSAPGGANRLAAVGQPQKIPLLPR